MISIKLPGEVRKVGPDTARRRESKKKKPRSGAAEVPLTVQRWKGGKISEGNMKYEINEKKRVGVAWTPSRRSKSG